MYLDWMVCVRTGVCVLELEGVYLNWMECVWI